MKQASASHRSGFVAVLGAPNAGKSTLVNALAGRKVAGVSSKPQTTRRSIIGIRTEPDCQIVFIDTPGCVKSKGMLGEIMESSIVAGVRDADLVLLVVDSSRPVAEEAQRILGKRNQGAVLVLSKVDLVEKECLLPLMDRFCREGPYREMVPVSALRNDGIGLLLDIIRSNLPEGPRWYEDSAQVLSESLVQEVVQEQLFKSLSKEVPYGCAVLVESVKREKGLVKIEAAILTERERHKPIIIGRGGENLKRIGTEARKELERAGGDRVFISLWVRVEKDWSERQALLADLGYMKPGRSG